MAETLSLPKADPATENLPPGAVPPPTAAPPPYQALAATAPPPSRSPSVAYHRPPHPQLIVAPQIVVSQVIPLGRFPQLVQCPNCMATVTTSTTRQLSCTGWVIVIVLLFLCWPLSCVPCCIDDLYDVSHFCPNPNCNSFVGRSNS